MCIVDNHLAGCSKHGELAVTVGCNPTAGAERRAVSASMSKIVVTYRYELVVSECPDMMEMPGHASNGHSVPVPNVCGVAVSGPFC